jgi:hypothetical protein
MDVLRRAEVVLKAMPVVVLTGAWIFRIVVGRAVPIKLPLIGTGFEVWGEWR